MSRPNPSRPRRIEKILRAQPQLAPREPRGKRLEVLHPNGDLTRAPQHWEESQASLRTSELRYRRLFARDGILILDPRTRKITDANPFMTELLGYPHAELLGKKLWEIGLLKDEKASQAPFRELQDKKFIRYEKLATPEQSGPAPRGRIREQHLR